MAKSYTQWSTFKQCGAKYKYQYVDRLPRGPTGAAAQRGTDFHALAERIIKGEEVTEDLGPVEPYLAFFQKLHEKGAVAEMGFAINEEWKPVGPGEETWVRGYIDAILPPSPERDDTIYIYELKTGKEWPDHVEQRHFYGTVSLHMYPEAKAVKVIGTYMDLRQNRENIYSKDMLGTYSWMWKNRLATMDAPEGRAANPGFHCRWCPYAKDMGGPCKFSTNAP